MQQPDREQFRQHLQSLPYFADLDPAEVEHLARLASWHEYAKGAVVFLEGDTNAGLYALHTGWLKVIKLSPDGREQVLRYIGPGEFFNEIGIFLARPNPATAVALEASGLWLLNRNLLRRVLADHPAVLLQIMGNMADRIAYLVELVADLSLHTVEARLARLLLDEATADTVHRPTCLPSPDKSHGTFFAAPLRWRQRRMGRRFVRSNDMKTTGTSSSPTRGFCCLCWWHPSLSWVCPEFPAQTSRRRHRRRSSTAGSSSFSMRLSPTLWFGGSCAMAQRASAATG
jgi:CRP-like cAMP-binding protein